MVDPPKPFQVLDVHFFAILVVSPTLDNLLIRIFKMPNLMLVTGNIIVFPQTSKFKSYLLSSDVREGTVDVVAKGMAVLWSSLDRRARQSFNEDALYAYDVNAMRNICEESNVRKK